MRVKSLFVSIVMILLMSASLMAEIRMMAPDDTNLDSSWDWRSMDEQALFSCAVGEKPASEQASKLPFFIPGNPLKTDPPDMDEKDGWVLVHRDFGIKECGQVFPLFTLYNRYRGTFRVMLFNALVRQESYYLGELEFLNSLVTDHLGWSLLSFPRKNKCFLNDFDPQERITSTSFMQAFGDWAVFDFPLLGYDPASEQNDPILSFRLTGIDFQKLRLEGKGDIDLIQRIEQKEVRPTLGAGDLVKAANVGLNYYRSPLNWMDELTNVKNKDKNWYQMVMKLSKSSAISFMPWIAALGGVVETFVGGANKASHWEPLSFSGQLKLHFDGTLMLERRLWAHDFYLKPGPQTGMAQRPLQAVPWGIFNVRSTPVVVENIQSLVGLKSKIYYYKLASDWEIIVNPSSGMDLVSTEVAMKFDRVLDKSFPPYGNGTGGSDLKTDTMEFIPFKSFADFGFIKTSGPANPIEIIYKLRFKIRQPTLNSDSEIVIMKTVAIERPVQRGMRTFASPQLEEGHPGGTLLAEGEVAVPWGPAPPAAAASSRSGLLASPDG